MFIEVEYIEATFMALESVGNLKEEPLGVTVCIDIVLKEEIVLVVGDLADERQVSALKAGLEHQGFIVFIFRNIELLNFLGIWMRLVGLGRVQELGYIAGPDVPVLI